MEIGAASQAEIPAIPARMPGSIQRALRSAGVIPDWSIGFNARRCEWVENRHWIFAATLPADWMQAPGRLVLHCLGLDYSGWIFLNGREAGSFRGTFVPHRFDLTSLLKPGEPNQLEIIFDCPPRWLGQFGYTSKMTEWKPRFNYTWDWTSRLVQIGIWDKIVMEAGAEDEPGPVHCTSSADLDGGRGRLRLQGGAPGESASAVAVKLNGPSGTIFSESLSREQWVEGREWSDLEVDLWYPNGFGAQPLYELTWQSLDDSGATLDSGARTVGFKRLEWELCEGAPPEADPWICRVNGEALFLQGVNWTPIRPNFADVTEEEYRKRLELYQEIGCNMMRVWGGAFLEKDCFYRLCDEFGLLVWQELPLSSSGVENWPPEDERSIREMEEIATSYIIRRRHHVSLAMWCGGNELQGSPDGGKTGVGKPIDMSHPMMERIDALVRREDAGRRFMASSSSGPRFGADEKEFGRGLHWDVHGPWIATGPLDGDWTRYWENDDALFRSETGAPGASPVDVIRENLGECKEAPFSLENPIWRRTPWWVEWPMFLAEGGSEGATLEDYVSWSQERQAAALSIAARACKRRFPRCGGFIVWMGHDSFPCMANTAIVDFHGRPKPAALALKEVFLSPARP